MGILRIISIITLGIIAEFALFFVVAWVFGADEILKVLFRPWLAGGEWLFPTSGPGGHAMAGGALLGGAIGFLVYAAVIGFLLDRLLLRRVAQSKRPTD